MNKMPMGKSEIIMIAVFFFAFVPSIVFASSVEIIKKKGPAPSALLMIERPVKFGTGITLSSGPHGLKRECFQSNGEFLVLEKNVVGDGYEIQSGIPNGFNKIQCIMIDDRPSNKLGITIGTSKISVESMLGVNFPDSIGIVQWSSKKVIRSVEFDIQTTAEFEFLDSKLSRIWVFTTTTN